MLHPHGFWRAAACELQRAPAVLPRQAPSPSPARSSRSQLTQKARPIVTIFTTMSAFRNIDHGDSSLGNEPILRAVGPVDSRESPAGIVANAGLLSTALRTAGGAEELGAVRTAGGTSDRGASCASACGPAPIYKSRTRPASVDRGIEVTEPRPGLGWTSRYISSLIPLARCR